MSLINKMLQDLDARGTPGADPLQSEIRPVSRSERRIPLPVVAVSIVSAVALAAGGYAALRYLQNRTPAPVKASTANLAPQVILPPAASAPVVTAPAVTPPVAEAPVPVQAQAQAPIEEPGPVVSARAPTVRPQAARVVKGMAEEQRARLPRKAVDVLKLDDVSPSRGSADARYRRALESVAEGRIHDSINLLEEALRIDPRHEGARQTLVSLLVENNRGEEALRQLQAGLAANPAQPSMAMLLARMQIERGGNGIDTLLKTLPNAGGNAEYHAFLAGALQREQRFHEAAEQYQAALRRSPQHAVWLMGLGISLQGDARPVDALDAFQRAKAVGTLSPELQAFVERKITSLSR